jgi:translation initiation factor 1
MSDICTTCGLPQDLCVCEAIAKENQKISVTIERKKFRKEYTIINGITSDIDIKDLGKQLKNKLACGGTVKDGVIELQGSHMREVREFLIKQGFAAEMIELGPEPPRPQGRRR